MGSSGLCSKYTFFFSFFLLTPGLKSVPHKFVKTRFSESNSAMLCRENVGYVLPKKKSDSWFEFRSMRHKINQSWLVTSNHSQALERPFTCELRVSSITEGTSVPNRENVCAFFLTSRIKTPWTCFLCVACNKWAHGLIICNKVKAIWLVNHSPVGGGKKSI